MKTRTITKYFRPACFWNLRWLQNNISCCGLSFFLVSCSVRPDTKHRLPEPLADGSKIFKDDSTVIRLDSGFNRINRVLYLKGKAVFEIYRNEDKPFIIHTRLLEITVGDSSDAVFGIDASDTTAGGGEEVDLLKGKLKVVKAYESKNDYEPVIIRSGELIMINKGIDLMEDEKFDTIIWKREHYAND